jgi:hypothetical protein
MFPYASNPQKSSGFLGRNLVDEVDCRLKALHYPLLPQGKHDLVESWAYRLSREATRIGCATAFSLTPSSSVNL